MARREDGNEMVKSKAKQKLNCRYFDMLQVATGIPHSNIGDEGNKNY